VTHDTDTSFPRPVRVDGDDLLILAHEPDVYWMNHDDHVDVGLRLHVASMDPNGETRNEVRIILTPAEADQMALLLQRAATATPYLQFEPDDE
jgi:hypothetical protein